MGGSLAAAIWGGSKRQLRFSVWVPTIWTHLATVALGDHGLIERTAGAIQTVAIGLVWSSWIVVALAVAGAVAWDLGIRPVEEADLEARFGDDYIAYQARVRRWVPRPARIPRGAVP